MEIQKFKNEDLTQKIKFLFAQERKLTRILLLHIAEVDRRKLFLTMAYPSLFGYLTQEIGYSAGSAQRRIDAARLIQRLPEMAEKIESGSLSLVQISKVQRAFRQVRKESGRGVELRFQKEIFNQIEGQGLEKTELILAQNFQLEVKMAPLVKIQKDESSRVEITFSKEEMSILRQAQGFSAHKTGGSDLKDCILLWANREIARRGLSEKLRPQAALKKQIFKRDQVCQYKNAQSGKVCRSNYFLEMDHIRPRWAGGADVHSNLRVLCRHHNQFRYNKGQ